MKQAILTALIAGQPETTGTAGSCSQLRKSQGSWMRDLGNQQSQVQQQGVVKEAVRGRTEQLPGRTQRKPAE